ncbi:MAG: ATP-dependent sacrificial sulfur transferase LarE [Nitrospirota bacterium]|mgnify:CR=1 FL=1
MVKHDFEDVEERTREKLLNLKSILSSLGSVCIAYSGGVDSTFLLRVAKDVLKEKVLAVTATSPTYPQYELEEAMALANKIGVKHLVISSNELDIPGFSDNSTNRCYYCKNDLFRKLKEESERYGIKNIADGSNYDDTKDYRPGRTAAKELGVISPLCEAWLTKNDIRSLSKELGLETWNKPSLACLSSRIPYNEKITEDKLKQVEKAEGVLRSWGFTQFRVRHHNDIARLELISEEMSLLDNAELRLSIDSALKSLGFKYVAVDLLGYRTGSMNEVIKAYER